MTAQRRHPGTIPGVTGEGLPGLVAWARGVVTYLQHLQDGFSGRPPKHADTHRPDLPIDPLATAAPSNPTGTAAAPGTAGTLLRSDSVTKQGIVVARGQLLGHNASVPAPVPAPGASALVLTSNLALPTYMEWAAPTGGAAAVPPTIREVSLTRYQLTEATVGQYALRKILRQNFR